MAILNQEDQTNCGTWAIMGILQHYWVQFDFDTVSKIREPLIIKLQNRFIALWLIKYFIPLPNTRLVDLWLARKEYLLTGTNFWDFTLGDNEWWLVELDWKSQHYFIIVENCWDKWKCQNSWGDGYWDKGYMYVKKTDFSKLFTPRRLALK